MTSPLDSPNPALMLARKHDTGLSIPMNVDFCGQTLTPLKEAALFWPAQKTLIVSDLHLEKGSSYAMRGQHLPPYDTRVTLDAVGVLIERYQPKVVISLGDSFHDPRAHERLHPDDVARIRKLTSKVDWVWVEGNHDPIPPLHLGGRATHTLKQENLIFRHKPAGERAEIAGHLHPCARVTGRGRSMRRRCFIMNARNIIMPAFGAYTGGLNVLDPAYNAVFEDQFSVFIPGQDRVYSVKPDRLLNDRPKGAGWKL